MSTTTHTTSDAERLAHVAACLHQVTRRAGQIGDGYVQRGEWAYDVEWGWIGSQATSLLVDLNLPADLPPDENVPEAADVNELLAEVEATIRPVRLGDFLVPPAWEVRLLELQAEVTRLAR